MTKSKKPEGFIELLFILVVIIALVIVIFGSWSQKRFEKDCESIQKNMAPEEVQAIMNDYNAYEPDDDKEAGYFFGSWNIDTFNECHIYFEEGVAESVRWTENEDGGKEPTIRWLLK